MANITITSDSLINIEQHFRVSAGPGAGKTHWLVNHIKNVMHNSDRLSNSKKIACITYTNIAVHTIMNRLSNSSNNVVVSTIHSFLYKHIIKPYLRFIAADYGVDIRKVDGHDDIIIGRSLIINWITNLSNKNNLRHPFSEKQLTHLPDNIYAVINWASTVKFKLDANDEIFIASDRRKAVYNNGKTTVRLNKICLDTLESNLLELKQSYWAKGLLHHDDVLFFSYILITKFPFILNVLRAKFPYFFVDEFQDSNPIQVKILNMIGQEETVVGIIGDKAQSIYGFQGAESSHFDSFMLNGMINYSMLENRRSTNEIIDFLDHIRPDFIQSKFHNKTGEKPLLVVGDKINNFMTCRDMVTGENLCTLTRKNIVSNIMKREVGVMPPSDLFGLIAQKDNVSKRRKTICSFTKAVEFARNNRYKDAIKEIKSLKRFDPTYKEVKKSIETLQKLLDTYSQYSSLTLKEFSDFISSNVIKLAKATKGNAFELYNSSTYQQLAVSVIIVDDDSLNRTIHKAKGDEFDNVMLILESEKDLKFLSEPDLTKEEHRIMYVAASRAKNRLFISVPTLSIDSPINNLVGDIINI